MQEPQENESSVPQWNFDEETKEHSLFIDPFILFVREGKYDEHGRWRMSLYVDLHLYSEPNAEFTLEKAKIDATSILLRDAYQRAAHVSGQLEHPKLSQMLSAIGAELGVRSYLGALGRAMDRMHEPTNEPIVSDPDKAEDSDSPTSDGGEKQMGCDGAVTESI